MSSFAESEVTFTNGVTGEPVEVLTANPVNYHEAISQHEGVATLTIHGKLFRPSVDREVAAVVVVPGSLGVAPSHLSHAETLTEMGIAAFVIDPFGARSVSSTVANQTQYSFAASAWDVLMAASAIASRSDIDASRIGAQGHSRGGSAVLTAATNTFSNGFPVQLKAVYAAYPWSGHQFLNPSIGHTKVRAVVGDQDEWCLPQQVQGHIRTMVLAGGDATCRIFANCHHSFDRDTPIELIEDASVSPSAPTTYIDDSGAFIHPVTGESSPDLVDRDLMVYSLKAGYGIKGARIGSEAGQAAAFKKDMTAFWQKAVLK